MSDRAFSDLVDSFIEAGMDVENAIAAASNMDAHHEDPFLVMRQKAIDEGRMF